MAKMEREADAMTTNGKRWFSEKIVTEIIKQSKDKKEIEKKLKFLKYQPKREE